MQLVNYQGKADAPFHSPNASGSNRLGLGGLPTDVKGIKDYLHEAFHMDGHPLCILLKDLNRAFRESYTGCGEHRRLLTEAVLEVCLT